MKMPRTSPKSASSRTVKPPKTRPHQPASNVSPTPSRRYAGSAFARLYEADALERVKMIRAGLPATALLETGIAMGVPRESLLSTLRLARATVNRKISKKETLSPEMSERVLGLQKLIGQVEVMVRESGEIEGFDPAKWVAHWLEEPLPALGGQKPAGLMDTVEGQEIVSRLLSRMQSGAYS